jgi:DNA excision repair protein ERCC-4
MPKTLRVVVDEREKTSGIPNLLKQFGLLVEHRMLDVGDYIISPDSAIERKRKQDFLKSLYSGRLFDQAYRLSQAYEHSVLIVEGKLSYFMERMAKPRVFWGALATLTFQYGLNIFFTTETQQTADLIYALMKHRSFGRPKGPFVQKKPKTIDLEKSQLTLVSSLPGVGLKLADRVLKRFGTVRRVFCASVAEFSLVKGVGRKKAEKIAKVLDAPYPPMEKPPKQLELCQS